MNVNKININQSEPTYNISDIYIADEDSEFSVADENGGKILDINNGEIRTRKFDSRKVSLSEDLYTFEFAVSDDKNNATILAVKKNGHIKTKSFDSETAFSDIQNKIDNATEPFRSNKGLLYSKLFNLDTDISEYNNIDGTNNKLTNDGLLLSSNGNRVTLNRYYSLSDRTVEYLCKFDSSSVAVFTTDGSAPLITIDMSNKKFSILNDSVIDEVNLDAGIESHLFKLQVTKHYQVQSATLIDITINKSYTVSKLQDGEGGAGAGSLNPTPTIIGMQLDKYCFYAASGQFYVKNIKVVCNVNNVKLLMYGDSITEPEAYYTKENFAASWTQLVMSQINGTAVSSGRSGTNIDDIFARISNELPYINTKYVMVTIGTNGGNTLAKLRQLVDYIKSCGVIPILNNIPCNDNNGTSNTAENNAMIQQVRTEKGINGCLFDIATSEDGDGETLDYSTMYEEEYPNVGTWYHHPNPKGAEAMFLRTMIDVPEIYD